MAAASSTVSTSFRQTPPPLNGRESALSLEIPEVDQRVQKARRGISFATPNSLTKPKTITPLPSLAVILNDMINFFEEKFPGELSEIDNELIKWVRRKGPDAINDSKNPKLIPRLKSLIEILRKRTSNADLEQQSEIDKREIRLHYLQDVEAAITRTGNQRAEYPTQTQKQAPRQKQATRQPYVAPQQQNGGHLVAEYWFPALMVFFLAFMYIGSKLGSKY